MSKCFQNLTVQHDRCRFRGTHFYSMLDIHIAGSFIRLSRQRHHKTVRKLELPTSAQMKTATQMLASSKPQACPKQPFLLLRVSEFAAAKLLLSTGPDDGSIATRTCHRQIQSARVLAIHGSTILGMGGTKPAATKRTRSNTCSQLKRLNSDLQSMIGTVA